MSAYRNRKAWRVIYELLLAQGINNHGQDAVSDLADDLYAALAERGCLGKLDRQGRALVRVAERW